VRRQQPRDAQGIGALQLAFVRPQDGQAKQDCELNAATRWLQQWRARIAPWRTTLLGDDLYCHQPFCEQVLALGCAFLFVCLPPSHTLLYEWVADFERIGAVPTLVRTRWTGKQRLTETYRHSSMSCRCATARMP